MAAGEIVGAFGVRGWVKVQSHTQPPANILGYSPWYLTGARQGRAYKVLEGKPHGALVIARLDGITDRNAAASLRGSVVEVPREALPPLGPGEFYWADLVGLKVLTLGGSELGRVSAMFETGANDVMVVEGERERLIPFVLGEFVKDVRLEQGLVIVDWDPDF
ncbi:Ribosome maturation factor RimM [Candidatus Methylocalor cossyra]|uniref:Ribosome maturation factor RimM n=1 Tax=Candidatus Methylocalor cossyra TaxID=3108543 RepID=A0ABM9NEG2_9GAMM